jgi:hypothetical protein
MASGARFHQQEKTEMQLKKTLGAIGAGALLAGALVACGGGGGAAGATQTSLAAQAEQAFSTLLSQLGTATGLSSLALGDLFAGNFVDAGFTRAQLLDALKQEAAAMNAAADYSLFPQATVSNVVLTDCSQDVCTMSGTLTNNDAESTSVPFSTKVSTANGQIKLLGDQQAS